MKNNKIIAAIAAPVLLAAISCNRQESTPEFFAPGIEGAGEPVEVTFGISDPLAVENGVETKAASELGGEATVSSLTVYVYNNSTDAFVAKGTASSSSVNITLTKGVTYKAYAVVNKTISTASPTIAQLQAETVALNDNTASHFVMFGSKTGINVDGSTVTINVSRIASKVSIVGNVTNKIAGSTSLKVKGLYLKNVPVAAYPLFSDSYTPSTWANQLTYVSNTSYNSYLYQSISGTAIALNGTYAVSQFFYMLPNPTSADANGSPWSARHTRVVLVADVVAGGVTNTYYYPITLPVVPMNTHVTITDIDITKIGQTAAEEATDSAWSNNAAVSFTVSVSSWATSSMGKQTF